MESGMTTDRTITINNERRPLGIYTWVATLRDGAQLIEFETGQGQLSFDIVACRDDVTEVTLIPIKDGHPHITIDIRPGERVEKKWIRTFQVNLDTHEQSEFEVVDAFRLISNKIINHFFVDGVMIVTTRDEP